VRNEEHVKEDRYLRQKDVFDPEELKILDVSILGVGAVGRQIALQLASIGVANIELIDFDKVEEVNLGPQIFRHKDLGRYKVDVTRELMLELNPDIKVETHQLKWEPGHLLNPVVFVGVDTMECRKAIWDDIGEECATLIDTRMSAESSRVLTVYDSGSREYYPTTLYHDNDAIEGSCTNKTTTFCANITAGLAVSSLSKVMRGAEYFPYDYVFDIKALELMRMKEAE